MKKLLFCVVMLAGCSVSRMGAIVEPKRLNENHKPAEAVPIKTISPIRSAAQRDSVNKAYIKSLIDPYVSEFKESQRLSAENLEKILKLRYAKEDSLSAQNLYFQNRLTQSIFSLDSVTREGFTKDWKIDSLSKKQEVTNTTLSEMKKDLKNALQVVNTLIDFYKRFSSVIFFIMIAYFITLLALHIKYAMRTGKRKSHA